MTVEEFKASKGLPALINALYEEQQWAKSKDFKEYRAEIDCWLVKELALWDKTKQIIEAISDPFQRKVVMEYTMHARKTFEMIADEKYFCPRTIQRAYKAGIDELIANGTLTDARKSVETPL